MGLFSSRSRREPEPPPANTDFSVSTGPLRLASGEVITFTTIGPTVFGGSDEQGGGDSVVAYETVLLAEVVAQATHPGAAWANEREVTFRAATPEETQWALANGVNELFR